MPVEEFFGMIPNGISFTIMRIDIHTLDDGIIVETFHFEDWTGPWRRCRPNSKIRDIAASHSGDIPYCIAGN